MASIYRLSARLKIAWVIRAICVRVDGYAEVFLVFLVCETRKAEHSRRIGRCGIAVELPRQSVDVLAKDIAALNH
jgi:hypothetical protein